MDNVFDGDTREISAKTERQNKTVIADTKRRMEEVRNRLRKKARAEERQQILDDVFSDLSDKEQKSKAVVSSSVADSILDD